MQVPNYTIDYQTVYSDYPIEGARKTGEQDGLGRYIYAVTYKVMIDTVSGIETVIERV